MIVGIAAVTIGNLVAWGWAAEDGTSAADLFEMDVALDAERLGLLVALDGFLARRSPIEDFIDVRSPDEALSEAVERFARSREVGNFARDLGLNDRCLPLLRDLSNAMGWVTLVAPFNAHTPQGQLVRKASWSARPAPLPRGNSRSTPRSPPPNPSCTPRLAVCHRWFQGSSGRWGLGLDDRRRPQRIGCPHQR